ncbi:MAG: alpha/beta hydrolase fold domain-containing protein [Akkermansiaceae bacterium]|jgi:acetyl esterase/lipase|nr:alpha/beta hydrolase fold domain-containing protein [Akkermansiaceae bacterium]
MLPAILRRAMPLGLAIAALFMSGTAMAATKIPRIMAVGDSITEGGTTFENYRFPLWEKLFAAGYTVEFVGSKASKTRIGPLRHEGYSGKNAEFLAETLKKKFPAHPADILLIHAGHNHEAKSKPIPGIIAAHEAMIRTARKTRPGVNILVAQVILSGKLPKYAYLADLNKALAAMVGKLDTPKSRVILVDMASGFDWRVDTIQDHVHPNAQGAAKMADRWFDALRSVLPAPEPRFVPEKVVYKKPDGKELKLHIFRPEGHTPDRRAPAIVFFFGGGWVQGTPIQFYSECTHFARQGIVTISAEYRISSVHGTRPFASVADAKSAIRWVRQNAEKLGVDPAKIIGAGGSAGGHIAAAAALVPGLDDPSDNLEISPRPDLLLLWYPVLDNGPTGYGPPDVKARFREFSPFHQDLSKAPPTLIFLGTKDGYLPEARAKEFEAAMRKAGRECSIHWFPGGVHPVYHYSKGPSPQRAEVLKSADAFLLRHGLITK